MVDLVTFPPKLRDRPVTKSRRRGGGDRKARTGCGGSVRDRILLRQPAQVTFRGVTDCLRVVEDGGAPGLCPRRALGQSGVYWPPPAQDADELAVMLFKHVLDDGLGFRVLWVEGLQLLVPEVIQVRQFPALAIEL